MPGKASGIKTAPTGHHVTREDRQFKAETLFLIRQGRSNLEQLSIIAKRRGESKKEKARLTA